MNSPFKPLSPVTPTDPTRSPQTPQDLAQYIAELIATSPLFTQEIINSLLITTSSQTPHLLSHITAVLDQSYPHGISTHEQVLKELRRGNASIYTQAVLDLLQPAYLCQALSQIPVRLHGIIREILLEVLYAPPTLRPRMQSSEALTLLQRHGILDVNEKIFPLYLHTHYKSQFYQYFYAAPLDMSQILVLTFSRFSSSAFLAYRPNRRAILTASQPVRFSSIDSDIAQEDLNAFAQTCIREFTLALHTTLQHIIPLNHDSGVFHSATHTSIHLNHTLLHTFEYLLNGQSQKEPERKADQSVDIRDGSDGHDAHGPRADPVLFPSHTFLNFIHPHSHPHSASRPHHESRVDIKFTADFSGAAVYISSIAQTHILSFT